VAAEYSAGLHRVGWDGRDSGGRAVSSGLYFYRLEAGGFDQTRRMVLLR
jgi:flagellar hook assembly protein FlgD